MKVQGQEVNLFWTDYPIIELGDAPGVEAPVRKCKPVDYDGDKYLTIEVSGIRAVVKRCYVYKRHGRSGDVPVIGASTLRKLRRWMRP